MEILWLIAFVLTLVGGIVLGSTCQDQYSDECQSCMDLVKKKSPVRLKKHTHNAPKKIKCPAQKEPSFTGWGKHHDRHDTIQTKCG